MARHFFRGPRGDNPAAGRTAPTRITSLLSSTRNMASARPDSIAAALARVDRRLVSPSDETFRLRAQRAIAGIGRFFQAVVCASESLTGKPAPDVYLEAAKRLGVDPARCVAIEDSTSGIRSAHAAGMHVVAIPNRAFPPPPDVLALAEIVPDSIAELGPETIKEVGRLSTASSG